MPNRTEFSALVRHVEALEQLVQQLAETTDSPLMGPIMARVGELRAELGRD